MPVNELIPLSVRPPEFASPFENARNALAYKQIMLQPALRDAYVWNGEQLDEPSTLRNLQRIDPQTAMKFAQERDMAHRWEQQAAGRQQQQQLYNQSLELKQKRLQLQMLHGMMKGAYDRYQMMPGDETTRRNEAAQFYQQGLQALQQQGLPVGQLIQTAGLPAQFDPNAVGHWVVSGETQLFGGEGGGQGGGGAQNAQDEAQPPEDMELEPGAQAAPEGQMMPAAMQTGEPQAQAVPAVMQGEPQGQMMPAARYGAPAQGGGGQAQAPALPKPEYDADLHSRRLYATAIMTGAKKINPNAYMLYDPQTRRWIPNEPYIALQMRMRRAGATNVNVGPEAIGLNTKAQGEAQDAILQSEAGLARIRNIAESFRPEYLQTPTKWLMAGVSAAEKAGISLSPEMKDKLEAYSIFREDAFDNINRYIKEITGAQMSELEADRIRRAMPDPEHDGPTVFQSKLGRAQTVLSRAADVYKRLLTKGIPLRQAEREAANIMLTDLNPRANKGAEPAAAAPAQGPASSAPPAPLARPDPAELKAGKKLNAPPDPALSPNAIIRSPEGTRYRSDGTSWKVIK